MNDETERNQTEDKQQSPGERPVWLPFGSSILRQIFILATSIVLSVAILYSLLALARPIAILLASIIIAVALSPLVTRLERWLPRGAAVVVVYSALVLLGLVLMATVGVAISGEIRGAVNDAPQNRPEVIELLAEHSPLSQTQVSRLLPNEWPVFSDVLASIPLAVATTIAEIVIAFFLSVYWLLAAPALRRYFLSQFASDDGRESASDVLDAIGFKMGGYIRTLAIDALILGTVTFIGLTLLDVPLASLLALTHGIAVFVPVIGPIVATVPAVLVAFASSPLKAAIVLAFYVIVQQIESNIVLPNVMRRQAEINPLLVVFAIFAGGTIGNILGALIAVPTAGAVQVIVTDVVAPRLHSHFVRAEAESA